MVGDRPKPVPRAITRAMQTVDFRMVTIDDLRPLSSFRIEELAMKFDLVEFATTLKPLAFLYIFKVLGANSVLYFDNDCWITDSLADLVHTVQSNLVVVTPHVATPIPEDGLRQKDINILQAGVFNFGFIAFSKAKRSLDFLSWWYERLRQYGYVRLERGMHFDQNWGHFIVVFFEHHEYYVIRDNRYNIAYWNLHYTGKCVYCEWL